MKDTSRRALACSVATVAVLAAAPTFAQTAPPTAAPQTATPQTTWVEEVIVTAQRRSESLQDVPVTVTVFGAEEIKQARIQSIGDVSTRTPGMQFDAFPASQPRIAIRGIGSSDKGAAGDPSSAVFVDEIYIGRPAGVAFDAYDVERIEVLKGPQGTLFGRNVVGGAINVVSRRPDLDVFDAGVQATVGAYDQFDVAGFLNAPIVEGRVAARGSLSWRTHDGYVENTFTGNDVEDEDTLSGRFQLRAEPTPGLRMSLTVDGTRDRATGPAQHVLDLDETDPLSSFWTIDRDRDVTASAYDGYQDRDTWGVRAQVERDLSFGTLSYLGSYRDLDYAVSYDLDGGNQTFNFIDISGANEEQTQASSHEIRLLSLPDSAIQWVVGAYVFNQDVDRLDILQLDLGGVQTEIYTQAAELRSYAAFGDVTVPITDRLSLIGGLRHTVDEKTYAISNTAGDAIIRGSEPFDVDAEADYEATTWRAGLDYALTPDHLLYGLVSRGFKSGGFQDTPESAADALDDFAPEYATQYEIGSKAQFLDGTLIWNNTVYVTDYSDLQTRRTVGLSIVTDNAGAATIKGYETFLNWRPNASAGLVVAYAWTDARFDEFDVSPGVDYAGNRISRTPEHKLVLSPSYDFFLAGGASLRLAADYRYESEIWDDNSNDGPERRDPTHFVDARAIWTAPSGDWSVSLWGRNLTEELTRTHQSVFLGANFGSYNPPRTYGVTLDWNF